MNEKTNNNIDVNYLFTECRWKLNVLKETFNGQAENPSGLNDPTAFFYGLASITEEILANLRKIEKATSMKSG